MHKLEKLILESYAEMLNLEAIDHNINENKDDESFDLEKEFEDNDKLIKFKDLPADMQKKFSKEIVVFGKNAPGDPNRDYVDADYETYYFTTSYNKETGSVGHRLVKLPSYSKLYNSFVKIIKDIKTLMGVDAVKNDAAAKEIFENIKTLFRQLQRYLRTNHPKQYDLMKMRRMAEGIKKAKTLLETNFNLYENNTVSVYIEDEEKEVDIDISGATKNQKGLIDYAIEIEEFPTIDDAKGMFKQLMKINSEEEVAYYYEFERGWGKDLEDDWKLAMLAFRDGEVLDSHDPDQIVEIGKNINEFVGGELEKRNEPLYDKLVPGSGNSDFIEGEILRAINRIIYRFYNDGDFFYKGYGAETAGPAHAFLTQSGEIDSTLRSTLTQIFNKAIGAPEDGYERLLKFALEKILDYIESKEGNYTKSNEDMFNYESEFEDEEDDYDDDYYDEEEEDEDYYNEEVSDENFVKGIEVIKQTLSKEGGAAGLEALVKELVKLGFTEDEVVKLLKKMTTVKQHRDGDYILLPLEEDKGQKISKANMDGYKKGNLKESLLDQVNEQEPEEKPDLTAPKETVLEDATDQMLSKFPTLKAAIIKLQTEDFKEFVSTIDWISPRPTTFRVNLKNGQDYILKWTGKTFQAQIMGKRYFIDKINDYQQALDKLNILYKEGPMSGAGEEEPADPIDTSGGGGGGGDFPGDEAPAGGGDEAPAADVGGGEEEGGADLTGEPVDFEEPAEEPEA